MSQNYSKKWLFRNTINNYIKTTTTIIFNALNKNIFASIKLLSDYFLKIIYPNPNNIFPKRWTVVHLLYHKCQPFTLYEHYRKGTGKNCQASSDQCHSYESARKKIARDLTDLYHGTCAVSDRDNVMS